MKYIVIAFMVLCLTPFYPFPKPCFPTDGGYKCYSSPSPSPTPSIPNGFPNCDLGLCMK